MRTLVLNCGSSSLKYQLIETEDETVIAKGIVERIGTSKALLIYRAPGKGEVRDTMEVKDHQAALQLVLKALTDASRGVMATVEEVDAVGHRVVHGAEAYSGSVLVTDEVMRKIDDCSVFAPLHNPPNLMGIRACKELMPETDQVAVFDTAFHQNMPPHAYLYALPYAMYEKYGIRRYGFHGTSHAYVSKRAAELLGRDPDDFRVIVAHLGGGASVAAVRNGVSVDTSMGFTPLEGLVMGTRCGDIDPAIIPYMMQKEGLSPAEIDNILNKQSGLRGLSRISTDMREIEEQAEEGSEHHRLALEIFCYRVRKYIGAYLAVLNGADAIVFTAGIGENSPIVRGLVCRGMENLGVVLDEEKNEANATVLSTGPVAVMAVPTNEELAIALETQRILHERFEQSRREREQREIEAQLAHVSEAGRAQIAILWSRHEEADSEALRALVETELGLKIDRRAFVRLLEMMDICRDETVAEEA